MFEFPPGWDRVRHLHSTSTMILFFRQISTAARTVSLALVLGIAIGGAPATALAGVGCAASEARCRKMMTHEDDCASRAVLMSCACESSPQPANSRSNRAGDLVQPGPSHGPHAYLAPMESGRSLLRPDYRLGRGLLIPIPILHASLLI